MRRLPADGRIQTDMIPRPQAYFFVGTHRGDDVYGPGLQRRSRRTGERLDPEQLGFRGRQFDEHRHHCRRGRGSRNDRQHNEQTGADRPRKRMVKPVQLESGIIACFTAAS
jgi:hypothetical protein